MHDGQRGLRSEAMKRIYIKNEDIRELFAIEA
jgi:hypothetical protein